MKTLPLACLAVMLFSSAISRALPMRGVINWTGNAGYSAEIKFDYESDVPMVDARTGNTPTFIFNTGLINLWTTVRAPNGQILPAGINGPAQMIQNGVLMDRFVGFRFSFNPQTLAFGSFNVGPVDYFELVGSATSITILDNRFPGGIRVLDSGANYTVSTLSRVPDSGSTAAMFAGSLLGFRLLRRKLHRR